MFGRGKQPITQLQFIVAGAQKAGTTALNYYLKRHPEVALPTKKELHFFDHDPRFAADSVSYAPLHAMFDPAKPGAVAGENTPNYLYWPPAMARIRDYNPAMKLIFVLRNPIERAFSQWNMQRARGIEPLDFLEAIRTEPKRLERLPLETKRKFAYLDRGRYAEQLHRVFNLFPREQLLIVRYESFRAEQEDAVNRIYSFLGLEAPAHFRPLEAHGIPYSRQLSDPERQAAREILQPDILELQAMLGWNCDHWR